MIGSLPAPFSARAAIADDYAYCYRLTKRNMLILFTRHWGGWEPATFRRAFDVAATTLVVRAGRRVGYICLKEDSQGLHLDNIQLSPAVQGRGLGTTLLTDILRQNQSMRLRLTTFADNPALRLYERLGFVVYRREGGMLRMLLAPKPTYRR